MFRQIVLTSALVAGGSAAAANPAHQALQDMSEAERTRTLAWASIGKPCRATTSLYLGESPVDDSVNYALICAEPDSDWVVQVFPDGSTTVTSCDVLRTLAGIDCLQPY